MDDEADPWTKLWIKYNPDNDVAKLYSSFDQNQLKSIDFYIDAIRFLPENIHLAFIKLEISDNSKNVLIDNLYPEVNSFARFPSFKFKTTITHLNNKETRVKMIIYGYDRLTEKVVAVGASYKNIFSANRINLGGHQLPLYRIG